MARVPYLDREKLPPERRDLLDSLAEGEPADHGLPAGPLNVYRAMAHAPGLLAAFREYGGRLWREGGLTPQDREFVILTTAYVGGSAYEWHQHVRVALDEGLTREAILAIPEGEPERLAPERAALVEYVARFVDGDVDDDAHDRLAEHYDRETVLAVGLLSGLYLGLGRLLDALAVKTEVPFVGWELEGL
jgi:alkylhydroperoxidase family enzyme